MSFSLSKTTTAPRCGAGSSSQEYERLGGVGPTGGITLVPVGAYLVAFRRSHIFVALLSPDYLASRYCWNIEYRRAMNRRARGTMRVVAAVVRPCDWKATRAAHFKLLPRDGRPVTRWRSADDAFLDIAEGIRGVVRAVRRDMTEAPVNASGIASSPKKKPDSVSSSRVTGRPKTNKARGRSRKASDSHGSGASLSRGNNSRPRM
jgi:hypothetical protein